MPINDGEVRLREAFAAEVLRGLRLGFFARLFSLGVIAVLLGVQNPFPDFIYLWALLAAGFLTNTISAADQGPGINMPTL